MYNVPTSVGAGVLPATGAAVALWMPLAGIAMIALGIALWRMGRSFDKDEVEAAAE